MINVLYEDNHVLVVEKPVNMPVQEDDSHDPDLLNLLKAYLKEKYQKPGNVYLGLVHRLDRPVGGVMVFAKTSKAASRLSDSVRMHELEKEYLAVVDGIPPEQEAVLEDYLQKDTAHNRSYVTDAKHGKYSCLSYRTIAVNGNRTLVHIHLKTGRSHQIRVQFSSRGLPLVNDGRYNPKEPAGEIGLFAFRLTFPHPTKKTDMTFTLLPKDGIWQSFEAYYDNI